jgi:hypothetical protein
MRFTTFIILFAAPAVVLSVPTAELSPSLATVSAEVLDQDDGFYFASYKETSVVDVEFTPIAEIIETELDTRGASEQLSAHGLTKRDDIIKCPGRKSNAKGILHEANRQLASNAAAKGHYGKNAWDWVPLFQIPTNPHNLPPLT